MNKIKITIVSILSVVVFTACTSTNPSPQPSAVVSTPTAAPTTPETTPTASPITLKDPNLKLYTSKAGFSVVYPSQAMNSLPESCSPDKKTLDNKEGNIPVVILEDAAKKIGFITFKTYVGWKSKQVSPGVYQGIESCYVKDTDLDLAENGTPGQGVEKRYPASAKFAYATINNDEDLRALAQKFVGIGKCQIHTKTKTTTAGVYSVNYTCPSESGDPYDESGYSAMKYSEIKKLAVIWTAHQQYVAFSFNNKMYDDKIEIIF